MTATARRPVAVPPLPRRLNCMFEGFRWSCARLARKRLNAVRLSLGSATPPAAGAVLVAMNHPSWLDPAAAAVLSFEFPNRKHFAAIEASEIPKYPFMERAGFFGVDTKSVRGAAAFLRTGLALLGDATHAVWVTAQGRFADVRERPLNLESGVGHLAARAAAGWVVPVAVEYPFWEAKAPEGLIRVGKPLAIADRPGMSGREWTAAIETAIAETMDGLAADAVSRDPARFRVLVDRTTGVDSLIGLHRRIRRGGWR